jgi:hypothetical protein
MKNGQQQEIEAIARESAAIEAAVQQAVREALIDHKRCGDPIVICENGEVRWIPAEEIVIPDLAAQPSK